MTAVYGLALFQQIQFLYGRHYTLSGVSPESQSLGLFQMTERNRWFFSRQELIMSIQMSDIYQAQKNIPGIVSRTTLVPAWSLTDRNRDVQLKLEI